MDQGSILHQDDELQMLSEEDLKLLHLQVEMHTKRVNENSSAVSVFCKEKAILAAESLSFYLKQQQRLLSMGLPQQDQPYWALVQKNILTMEKVLVELFKIDEGYLFGLVDEFPDSVVWMCLSHSLELLKTDCCQYACLWVDTISKKRWNELACLSKAVSLPEVLKLMAQGNHQHSSFSLDVLKNRNELSAQYAKLLIRDAHGDLAVVAHSYLATKNTKDSIEWWLENTSPQSDLFAHLLVRPDRTSWFRQYYLEHKEETHLDLDCWARILDLPEVSLQEPLDLDNDKTPVIIALSGDTSRVGDILTLLENADEDKIDRWVTCLYLLFGSELPLSPAQLGIDIDYTVAIECLREWWDNLPNSPLSTLRFGHKRDFDSSITVLLSPHIQEEFRIWVWRELCLVSRCYLSWSPILPPQTQYSLITQLKNNLSARENYNLRNRHAIMGY